MTAVETKGTKSRPTMSQALIALVFVIAGVLHLIWPDAYVKIVPPWLPAPALLVFVSGLCEVAGGVGVLLPSTRVVAGWGLIALLIAVFPANVQMLVDGRAHHATRASQLALIARLPLQFWLIWWVWRATLAR